MKCNSKSILLTLAGFGAAAAVAYAAFPPIRGVLLGGAPFLLLLLCPLSMMFMMNSMHSNRTDPASAAPQQIPDRDNKA
ncbi:MAG: DUF2933 domain-containing protein [Pararobbsia sp.]